MKLFQYWDAESPPPEVAQHMERIRRANPRLDHRLYSRESGSHFIRNHLGDREWQAFEACAVPAMQADYFRLCALLVEGGCYLDADSTSRAPLDGLLELAQGSLMVTHKEVMTTGVMVFKAPRDPFLAAMLRLATDNVLGRRFDNILVSTGPPLGDAVRALLDPAWLEATRPTLDAWGRAVRFGPLLDLARRSIEVTPELRAAYAGIRFITMGESIAWVGMDDPPYKETPAHWNNWQGSIYRELPSAPVP